MIAKVYWDDLKYLAPVFSVAQPKIKPVIAIAFAMVMCLPNVSTHKHSNCRERKPIY